MRMAGPGAKLLKPGEQLLNEGASLAHAYAAQIDNRILRRILQKTDDFIHRGRSFMTAKPDCVGHPLERAARIKQAVLIPLFAKILDKRGGDVSFLIIR